MANLVDTYDYTDGSGQLLFQVCRFDDKSFKQRRKGSNGSWIWGLEDTPRVLYKLPQIIGKEFVFFVEGEKDVHTVEKLGLPATTNPMGSKKVPGQQKKYDILAPLQDKRVYILPDNDEPGKIQAEQVGTLLIELGIPSEVKILNLPLENPGEDITDLCERLGNEKTIELLKRLVKSTDRFALKQLSLKLDSIQNKYSRANNCKNDAILEMGAKIGETDKIGEMSTNVHSMSTKRPLLSTFVHSFSAGQRDEDLFRLANTLVKGKMPENEIAEYLTFFAKNCSPPFSENETVLKIKSALTRNSVIDRNLTNEILDFVENSNGVFMSTDVHQCLLLSTRNEKKLCSKVLLQLLKDDIIERHGTKNGCWRKRMPEAPILDIFNVDTGDIGLWYPLRLHDVYRTLPKTLVVFAGTYDAGKTAFLMNFAIKNIKKNIPIRYMSSEMGEAEFKDRALNMKGVTGEDWRKIDIRDVTANFNDFILKDGINIIDYLEMSDAFYSVGGIMQSIYERLRNGIAVIAIQKDPNVSLGRGGSFSIEKPRLYVTLTANPPEGGIAKIEKLKNWNTKTNYRGHSCNYNIVNGNEISHTNWRRQNG